MSETPSKTWVSDLTDKRPIIGQNMGIAPSTLTKEIRNSLAKDPDRIQYTLTDGTEYTLRRFVDLSRRVAKASMSLGLQPLEGVVIHGFNAIEWFSADIGACLAAAIPAGIYTTNKPDICAYIINHSKARLAFVDDEEALDKILSVRDRCPTLRNIIIWGKYDRARYTEHAEFVLSWADFLTLGKGIADADLEARMDIPEPESVCKLIYTSGTTGPPKAVMISHDNAVFTARHFGNVVRTSNEDRMISYLPCSHIAANTIDILGPMLTGIHIYLAEPDALKGGLLKTLKNVRPTILIAVPRVFEKIHESMLKVGAQNGPVKRAIATWAKDIGRRAAASQDSGENILPWGYTLADMLVFQSVRKALGLDQCRLLINTSAPLQKVTDQYFMSLNFQILDIYGMSEATGPLTFNFPDYKRSTSGKVLPGLDFKIHNPDESGEGELCFRGRNIFIGYLQNAEDSASTLDDEGYIHSGDLGRLDENGFITITGRAKELLVTAGGENVAPLLVEETLILAMPALARAISIGDKMKFVSALMVPFCDENGVLTGPAAVVNPDIKTAAEAATDKTWEKYLRAGVEEANRHAISNAAKVKNFRLLSQDFSVEGGELTPTMKLKRKIVTEKYKDVIQSMYEK